MEKLPESYISQLHTFNYLRIQEESKKESVQEDSEKQKLTALPKKQIVKADYYGRPQVNARLQEQGLEKMKAALSKLQINYQQ